MGVSASWHHTSCVLRIATDDTAQKRLVLRAPPWGLAEYARRIAATALSIAVIAAGASGAMALHTPILGLMVVPVVVAIVSWSISRPAWQTAEVVIDGNHRTIRITTRGRNSWLSGGELVSLGDEDRVLRICAGLVAAEWLRRPEIGIELWAGSYDQRPMRRLTPTFAIAGVTRRDEARAFVEAIARRMGLRVHVERDDLVELQLTVSHRGQEPPPVGRAGSAYRTAAVEAGIDLSRAPSFEQPSVTIAKLPASVDGGELRARVRREEAAIRVERLASRQAWRVPPTVRWVAGITGVGALSGSILGGLAGSPFTGAVIGAVVPLTFAAMVAIAALTVSLGALLLVLLMSGVERALRGFVRTHPGGLLALRARRWSLDGSTLVVEGLARRKRYARGDAHAVVLCDRTHWREIWLSADEWVLLARSEDSTAPSTPVLDALAVEVARTLDVPIRSAS